MYRTTTESESVAVVSVTYSSRREKVGETHQLYPSRLSLMAFDAACYLAHQSGVGKMVIAGEQSHREHPETTGDLLHKHVHPDHDLEITVIRDEQNRLLNTPHQVKALIEEFTPDDVVTVVCWGFHEQRLRQGFEASSKSPKVEFLHVEDVIDDVWDSSDLWETDEQRDAVFRARYDLQVDWPTVKSQGLKDFASREKITRLAMKFGKSGWLIKLLTNIRRKGRYDDISEFAAPIMQTTS